MEATPEPHNGADVPTTVLENDQNSPCLVDGGSSTAESETETIVCANEPWTTFKAKIETLCQQLWPRATKLQVERIEGGATNRIVAVTVESGHSPPKARQVLSQQVQDFFRKIIKPIFRRISLAQPNSGPPLGAGEFIIRIPRLPDFDEGPLVDHDAAALLFAKNLISAPVPDVLRVETRHDNPIENWYVVQSRVLGTPLDQVWDDLSHKQRLSITREIGQVLAELTLQSFPAAGHVDPRNATEVLALTTPGEASNRTALAKGGVTPRDFITARLEAWAEQPHSEWKPYRALAELVTIESIGADTGYYFTHGDFYPRNILVQVIDDDTVRIAGIIDWDNAQFVPAFVAFEPPCWLWMNDDLKSGFLEGPNLRKGATKEPTDPLEQEIKQAFEEVVGQEWLDVAYRKDVEVYRWIWQIMIEGLWYDTMLWVAEDAIEELTGKPYEFRTRRPTDAIEGGADEPENEVVGCIEKRQDSHATQ